MIVTIVRFPARAETDSTADSDSGEPISVEDARAGFGANAATYLEVPGLLWKSYLLAEDRQTVGGVYWWTDRASAEAKFNDGWQAGVTEKYGAPPHIEWFDAPVVVDGRFDTVHVEAPPLKAVKAGDDHRPDGPQA